MSSMRDMVGLRRAARSAARRATPGVAHARVMERGGTLRGAATAHGLRAAVRGRGASRRTPRQWLGHGLGASWQPRSRLLVATLNSPCFGRGQGSRPLRRMCSHFACTFAGIQHTQDTAGTSMMRMRAVRTRTAYGLRLETVRVLALSAVSYN